MQAILVLKLYILMAGITISVRWISYHFKMSSFLTLASTITTVTDYTSYFTVYILDKFITVHEDLLPYLQRR